MGRQGSDKAVVLLSGGLDSATTLAIARQEGFRCHALTFDYGQRHRFEIDAARRVAEALGAEAHRLIRLDLSAAGGFGQELSSGTSTELQPRSALTDGIEVPKAGATDGGIPSTYVPARNTIFLSVALGYAEVIGSFDLYLGVNAVDFSGYPDCRPAFVRAFEALANLATAAAVETGKRYVVHAPLIDLSKAEIIQAGTRLGVDYSLTHTCYDPSPAGLACGRCDACHLRRAGFAAAGVPDPTRYAPAESLREPPPEEGTAS